jgi:hypothetical protein
MALGANVGAWLEDRFAGPDLDLGTWFPHYLPAWSSRELTRASYRLGGEGLTLDIPVDHPIWCEGDHEPQLRVSGIQSGNWSGPAGTPYGQQRFREGQLVREEQPRFEGWLPSTGRVEISASMELSPRSMAALWLSGFEDDDAQERCGELYAVDWDADGAVSTVDGVVVRRCPRPPTYPLQLMLAVFDFPQWSTGDDDHLVPRLVVDPIAGGHP